MKTNALTALNYSLFEFVRESAATAKSQYNFTDSESRILKGANGFVQATTPRLLWNQPFN